MAVTSPADAHRSTLVRSSAKTAAIRRGEIKISSPISLLSEEHGTLQDVYPPHPGAPPAPPPPAQPTVLLVNSEGGPTTYAVPPRSIDLVEAVSSPRPPTASGRPSQEFLGRASTQRQNGHAMLTKGNHLSRRASEHKNKTNRSSVSYDANVVADADGGQASQIKRRKSGLRTVLRRMFGSKKKPKDGARAATIGQPQPGNEKPVSRHNYHRSDPGFPLPPLTPDDMAYTHDPREGRVQSLPLGVGASDGVRPNPLGSHLPFPMNVNAPQPKSPQRDYLKLRPQIHPRRATLPSLAFTHPDADAVLAAWRPPGYDERGTGNAETLSLRESTIGVALTTREDMSYHRRSRSMDELRKLIKEQESEQPRRRSDELNEIRSWRISYLDRPESVIISAGPEQHVRQLRSEHHESHEIGLNNDRQLDHSRERDLSNEVDEQDGATIAADASSEIEAEQLDTPDLDRLVKPSRGPDSGIAASTDGHERGLVPDRLSYMEHRLKSLEDSVQRLNGRNNRHTVILESSGSRLRRRTDRQRAHSPVPGGAGRSSSPESSDNEGPLFSPGTVLFPTPTTNNAQMRAGSFGSDEYMTSLPPASIYPHLTPLYNALQYERSARKRLESELLRLQREMYDLQIVVKRLEEERGLGLYPTPSPDTTFQAYRAHQREDADKDVFETPREEISTPRLGAVEVDDDADIF